MTVWEGAYTAKQYDELIRLAEQLGFADDVAHWKAEKARLQEQEQTHA